MNYLEYILKRLLMAIPTLLIVSFMTFSIMRYDFTIGPIQIPVSPKPIVLLHEMRIKNPIDPLAELRQNPQISKAALEKEMNRLGLNKPFLEQYWLWLSHFVCLDFGVSFSGESVSKRVAEHLPNSMLLNIVVMLATWLIALPMGIYAALNWKKPVDTAMSFLGALGMGLPTFILALLFALVAVKTRWLPVGGLVSVNFDTMNLLEKAVDLFKHLFIPVTVLTITSIAGLQRQMRGNLLEVLEANYVRIARAKGLPENKVIYKHALRTAINPMVTLLGFEFAGLFSGAALTEMVLSYPGIGFLTLSAIKQTDTNLVMTTLMLGTFVLIIGNMLADILLKWVDPRIDEATPA